MSGTECQASVALTKSETVTRNLIPDTPTPDTRHLFSDHLVQQPYWQTHHVEVITFDPFDEA